MQIPFIDGLQNIIANLGTARDKASGTAWNEHTVSDPELIAMYRTSAIARKIIDLPAEDSLREWREWQATADQITAIEAEEKRLGIVGHAMKALKKARLFGGAAIYIGTSDTDLESELSPKSIQKGGVKYLTVLMRSEMTAGDIERDPRVPMFGKPKFYSMQTDTGAVPIHPSRLVILQGDELPNDQYAGNQEGWSDSVLNVCLETIRNQDATVANVASLVFEAKIDVFGISGFNDGLRNGGAEYEKMVLKRFSLGATGKSINGAVVRDVLDTYEQKSANFANLPAIMESFMQLTSAAASIPMTLLFGMSPGGLNASGDADTRGYYDRVKVMQSLDLQPAMAILDECLIRSALGVRPPELHYVWRPLWQPTAKERADTGKVLAETMKMAIEMDAVSIEAGGKSLVNALTESGAFPGLEDAADEFPADGDDLGGDDGDDDQSHALSGQVSDTLAAMKE